MGHGKRSAIFELSLPVFTRFVRLEDEGKVLTIGGTRLVVSSDAHRAATNGW